MVGAVVLGSGTPAFAKQPANPLRLIDNANVGGSSNGVRRLGGDRPQEVVGPDRSGNERQGYVH
jgi:hypothetical protein